MNFHVMLQQINQQTFTFYWFEFIWPMWEMLECNIECMRYATRESILYWIQQNAYFSPSFFPRYFFYVSFAECTEPNLHFRDTNFFDTNEMDDMKRFKWKALLHKSIHLNIYQIPVPETCYSSRSSREKNMNESNGTGTYYYLLWMKNWLLNIERIQRKIFFVLTKYILSRPASINSNPCEMKKRFMFRVPHWIS